MHCSSALSSSAPLASMVETVSAICETASCRAALRVNRLRSMGPFSFSRPFCVCSITASTNSTALTATARTRLTRPISEAAST